MANLYIVCVLLDTVFALGDFNATYFVSGGGPAMSTEVLATLGIRYAYTVSLPRLGVAEVMSALPRADPACLHPDAQAAHVGGAAMSATTAGRRSRLAVALSAAALCCVEAVCLLLGFVLLVWTLTPIYNMVDDRVRQP